jgi:hypothetical protein
MVETTWSDKFFPIELGQKRVYLDKSSDAEIEEEVLELLREEDRCFFLVKTIFKISGSEEQEWYCYMNNGIYECEAKRKPLSEPVLIFPYKLGNTWVIEGGNRRVEVEEKTKLMGRDCFCLRYTIRRGAPQTMREWYVKDIGLVKWIEYYDSHQDEYEIKLP